jgi:hypothetical protein
VQLIAMAYHQKKNALVRGTMRKVRLGRPPLPEEQRRSNLTFRVRNQLRARLLTAAQESDRSLSQELEIRLENSIAQEDGAAAYLGGSHNALLMRVITSVVSLIEANERAKWTDNETVRQLCHSALLKLLSSVFEGGNTWSAGSASGILQGCVRAFAPVASRASEPSREISPPSRESDTSKVASAAPSGGRKVHLQGLNAAAKSAPLFPTVPSRRPRLGRGKK